jgi:nitrogen fixation protein NifU and related proteins
MNDPYAAALLAHAKNPYGAEPVARGEEDAEAVNGACGDEIRVKLSWTSEGALRRMAYELHGCAVSAASASMAAKALEGRTRAEAAAIAAEFLARLGKEGFGPERGDWRAFNGIERFPARIRCAQLPWAALEKALARGRGAAG